MVGGNVSYKKARDEAAEKFGSKQIAEAERRSEEPYFVEQFRRGVETMSYKKTRYEAAEKFVSNNYTNTHSAEARMAFKAGHDACLQSEVVRGLVVVIDKLLEAYAQALKEIEK